MFWPKHAQTQIDNCRSAQRMRWEAELNFIVSQLFQQLLQLAEVNWLNCHFSPNLQASSKWFWQKPARKSGTHLSIPEQPPLHWPPNRPRPKEDHNVIVRKSLYCILDPVMSLLEPGVEFFIRRHTCAIEGNMNTFFVNWLICQE